MRCSEPGGSVAVAIVASRAPGRCAWVDRPHEHLSIVATVLEGSWQRSRGSCGSCGWRSCDGPVWMEQLDRLLVYRWDICPPTLACRSFATTRFGTEFLMVLAPASMHSRWCPQ